MSKLAPKQSQNVKKGQLRWLWVAAVIMLVDQLSKMWAVHNLKYAVPEQVFPGFNLTLLYNYGAAFSFLDNSSKTWQVFFLAAVALIVIAILLIWVSRIPKTQHILPIGLCLIVGGAVGNLYDRIAHGYVVDFLDFYVNNYHWPAFNVADSSICVGAILVIIVSFKRG